MEGVGECNIIAKGIWLTNNIAYARSQAGLVSNKHGTKNGYIYKVQLEKDTVIVDTTSKLPDNVFKAYKEQLNPIARFFCSNENWYSKFMAFIEKKHYSENLLNDELNNRLYSFCHDLGIDAIDNVLVSLGPTGTVQLYGRHAMLLLNIDKQEGLLDLVETV